MNRVILTLLYSVLALSMMTQVSGTAFAAKKRPMSPELAAKKENFRKQHEQRVSQPQRDTAAQSLKDQRKKVLKAKRDAKRLKHRSGQPAQ
ncbi:MAG: hypothetical protein PHN84_00010 [Desulfuromonadaceae bacterium]|nr:hypothetical protein [Desulfuromonadaceae bacterium]MDD2856121.1 hypothetical protein [Desulfuromonadaceae bacterium]